MSTQQFSVRNITPPKAARITAAGYCSNCHLRASETVKTAVKQHEEVRCFNCLALLSTEGDKPSLEENDSRGGRSND
jgi:transposase